MHFCPAAYWSGVQKTSWSDFHVIFNAVFHEYDAKGAWTQYLNLPWGWHHLQSQGLNPSKMTIQEKASKLSSAVADRTFTEPDFEVRDRASEIHNDEFSWRYFSDICVQAFRQKFQGCIPLVFNGEFRVTNQSGSEQKRLVVSFGGRDSVSNSPHGVYTLEDMDSREELHNCTLTELQIALNTTIIQELSGDDSDSGLPEELQSTGIQHVVEFGAVHKSSIPIGIIQKLPFIFVQEQDLGFPQLQEQWTLIRKGSELEDLQNMRSIKQSFIQRFHYKHDALKGLFRFMTDLQHYQTFNKDTSEEKEEKAEKADSEVSSECLDPNMGALLQLMTSEKK
jgi:hypothetical protein